MLLQGLNNSVTGIVGLSNQGRGDGISEASRLVGNIANILIVVLVTVSVIYIIYGAWIWINEGQQKAQPLIINAVVGIIVSLLAYVIVSFFLGGATWLGSLINL